MAKRVVLGMSRLAVVGVAVGVVVGAGCGGSSGKKETGGDGSAGDGAASESGGSKPSGGSGQTGGSEAETGGAQASGGSTPSGGSGQTGGTVSQSGGASSGGFGPATGGAAEIGGRAPQGGEGGNSPASGGTPSVAGASPGTGGVTLPEPEVGTVGTECTEPGALQCAGTHQRVVVTCNGDGEWEAFETCPVGQYCDTRSGETLGSCQKPAAECVGREPGETFCMDNDVVACGADTISAQLAEDCPHFCEDARCVDVEPCPTGDKWVNCSEDCGGRGIECHATSNCIKVVVDTTSWTSIQAVRTPPGAAAPCACTSGRRYLAIGDGRYTTDLKITVSAPWWVILVDELDGACSDQPGGQCLVSRGAKTSRLIVIGTDDPTAPSVNVQFQILDAEAGGASCP